MPDITIPKPTTSHILYGGAVEVHCFGRPQNWSFAGATPMEADWRNPGIRYRMFRIAERYEIDRIYVPNPSRFNGRIAFHGDFDVDWANGRVFRGPFADGVLLTDPDTAFAVSSGDCPTVILYDEETGDVVAAHAGFKSLTSLIDDSVVTAMFLAMSSRAIGLSDVLLWKGYLACGIGASHYRFSPSDHGFTEDHEKVCRNLEQHMPSAITYSDGGWSVSLEEVFRLQVQHLSIHRSHTGFDGACTYSDVGRDGQPLWHSHRRGDKTRNLVLVIRR